MIVVSGVSSDLMNAILSMDAYNRSTNERVFLVNIITKAVT